MSLLRPLLFASALAGAALWAPSAHALVTLYDTQISSSSAFTITGNTTVNNVLSFSRFNSAAITPGLGRKNFKLLGYDYILRTANAGGVVSLGNSDPTPISGPFKSQVALKFDRLDNNLFVSFDPILAKSTGTLPPGPSFTSLPLTGSAAGLVSPEPFIPLPITTNYEAPPLAPLPSLSNYSAS